MHVEEGITRIGGRDYQRQQLSRVHGQVDLLYRKGSFYLAVVVDVPEEPRYEPVCMSC